MMTTERISLPHHPFGEGLEFEHRFQYRAARKEFFRTRAIARGWRRRHRGGRSTLLCRADEGGEAAFSQPLHEAKAPLAGRGHGAFSLPRGTAEGFLGSEDPAESARSEEDLRKDLHGAAEGEVRRKGGLKFQPVGSATLIQVSSCLLCHRWITFDPGMAANLSVVALVEGRGLAIFIVQTKFFAMPEASMKRPNRRGPPGSR